MTRSNHLPREQASRRDQSVLPQPCLRLPNSNCPGIPTEAEALRRPDSASAWPRVLGQFRDGHTVTMRALIIKVLVGLLLAAIIVAFALFIFLFGSSARPV
jgi:hypothetical protein